MIEWRSEALGKSGIFFYVLYLSPIPGIIIFLFLSNIFVSTIGSLVSFIALFFGIIFIFLTIRVVEGVMTARLALRTIKYQDGVFLGETFCKKRFETSRFALIENDPLFKKIKLQFFFPVELDHLIIRTQERDYYVVGHMPGFEELRELLRANSQPL